MDMSIHSYRISASSLAKMNSEMVRRVGTAPVPRATVQPPHGRWTTVALGTTGLSVLLLAWWLAQQAQILFVSRDVDPTATVTATAEGSLVNTILVLAFAALGAVHVPAAL